MPERAPVVVDPRCRLHDPMAEIWVGVVTPGTEVVARVDAIESTLTGLGHPIVSATTHDDAALTRVHSPELVEHLRTVWDRWEQQGYRELGAERVVPYMYAIDEVLHGLPRRTPAALHAQLATYCYDTMTLIGPGTWAAARGAVDAALTAVDLSLGGEPVVYALTRPPGHHVTRRAHGGSCYLNNAAVAAQALRTGGHATVAVVDIDAHHGNGTQAIFYDRGDVHVASVHVDPGAGWFPHHVGFADETGRGDGVGANLNVPLPPGTGDDGWLAGVAAAVTSVAAGGATAVVVSLGVDAAVADPESPLQVTHDGYQRAGELIAALGIPVVGVQEGGYHLPSLGPLVGATLEGLAARTIPS